MAQPTAGDAMTLAVVTAVESAAHTTYVAPQPTIQMQGVAMKTLVKTWSEGAKTLGA